MTFIPAENGPDDNARRRSGAGHGTGDGETPTEAISTADAAGETISASADSSATRPMPAVSGQTRQNRYDLSPDPLTAPIETPPWTDRSAPRRDDAASTQPASPQQPATAGRADQARGQQYPEGGYTGMSAPAHQQAPYPSNGYYGGQGQGAPHPAGGYPAQPPAQQPAQYPLQPGQHPGQYATAPHGAAPDAPGRDVTFGIFVGQVLRAAILLALAAGVAYYALRTVGGQWADELAIQEGERALAQLPSSWVPLIDLIPVAVCAFWGVLSLIFALAANRWVPLLVAAGSGLGAVVSVQLLKRAILTKAPYGIQESPMNSLPSGHTAAAATAAVIAVMVAPARWRGYVAFLGALTTSLAGISTVLNGWHRPMDAIVSVLVVTCWAVLGALLLRCLIRPERWRPNRAIGSLVLGILLLLAAGAGLAAMQTVAMNGLALATGAAAILGVSLLCAHQSVRALRPRHRAA